MNKYPEYILKKLRQCEDLEENDKSKDSELNNLTPNEAFDNVCQWEGLIGYSETIKGWIADIYEVDVREIGER